MTQEDAIALGRAIGLIDAAIMLLQALAVVLALASAWVVWSWFRRWR